METELCLSGSDLELERRPSTAELDERKRERARINKGQTLTIFLVTTGALLVFFAVDALFGSRLASGIGFALRDIPPAVLYRLHKGRTGKSSFELLASQNPVFLQALSPSALRKVLTDRQRIRGGEVKNSLVAACAGSSTALSKSLASWNKMRGIRELVFVDYGNVGTSSHESLRLVNSIDRLGRIIHVTALTRNSSLRAPQRFLKAQALNLGVEISCGENIVLVECETMVSPKLVSEHQLSNRTFYAGTSFKGSQRKPLEYDVLYMKRQAFEGVHGFDERIDMPGGEHIDLVERLKKLSLRRLSMDMQMIRRTENRIEEPFAFGTDISAFESENALERSRKIPKLSQYISALATKELPTWNETSASWRGKKFGLGGFRFSALREQIESTRHRSRESGAFQVSGESDNLWIHAFRTEVSTPSMLSFLSPLSLFNVVLEAHRKLLHDDHHVPHQVLRFMEQSPQASSSISLPLDDINQRSSRLQQQVASYSPLLFEVVWRQKHLLVVNLEVKDAIELFVGTSWAIASAISMGRALLLAGDFLRTPVSHLLDYEGMADVMHREFNLNINIMRGNGNWDCGRSDSGECWAADASVVAWDEYNLTTDPSMLQPNASRHTLFNIVSKSVTQWDHDAKATISQRRLQEKAFAAISVSSRVGRTLLNTSLAVRHNLADATALWLTNTQNQTGAFIQGYMEHHASREGHRPLLFVTGSNAETIDAASETVPYAEKSSGPFDAFRRTADAWIAMQCRNVVFDSTGTPPTWVGADSAILEWRRIHAPESPHYGLTHLRPANDTSLPAFHKLEFEVEPSVSD